MSNTETTQHTPGPWQSRETNYGFTVDAVKTIDHVAGVRIPASPHETGATQAANAKLIAAAPDLLHALEVIKHMAQDAHFGAIADAAARAINKAKGNA